MEIFADIQKTKKLFHELLPIGKSFDVIEKRLVIAERESYMYFIDGFVKDGVVSKLMTAFVGLTPEKIKNVRDASDFAARYVPYVEVDTEKNMDKILSMYLSGAAVLIIDGFSESLIIDARTYPARSTEEPEKEKVLRGSRDGFVETVVFNTALLRRRIRDPKFTAEIINIGDRSRTDVVITYIEDLVDKKILKNIKDRLKNIDVRSLTMNQESLAECIIRKKWYNPFPKVRYTERPDVAAACILEGSIAVLVDNDPSALLLPSSIFDFIQEADDFYYPPVVGGYMRMIRNLVFFSTMILTPLWLLLVQNMDKLPEWLHFLDIAQPNSVPPVVQLLLLEVAIDVLRLASVNTPNMLGNSLSIIGALILGDFAIQSGWFVPDTILYMSIVAIASFSQPNIELNYAFKFMRIMILLLTYFLDIFGFVAGVIISFVFIATNKTITGRGYLYPVIPFNYHDFKYKFIRLKIRSKPRKTKSEM